MMKDRLTQVDLLNLADLIMGLPLQIEINIGSKKYLLAHAMTFDPALVEQDDTLYLEGLYDMEEYWRQGVKGYVSLVGHTDSSYQYNNSHGRYLDGQHSIWTKMCTCWIADVACQMGGWPAYVWKQVRDSMHELGSQEVNNK